MVAFADKPILELTSVAEWEAFLAADPPDGGVRLVLLKKAATFPGIRRDEALEVALCYGWIDGQAGGRDEFTVLQAYSPRRARSPWSQINVELAERLIAEKRMRPGGLAEIDRAKADGRWAVAYRQKDAEPPPELAAALAASPVAAEAWATLDAQNRWAMIFRTSQTKRQETRDARAAAFVGMLERGERIYPTAR